MKSFIIIGVIAIFALSVQAGILTDEQKDKLKGYSKECIKTTDVDKELVIKAREHNEFTEDEKLEEYYFCMFKKIDIMSDDGTFKLDVIKRKTPDTVDKVKAETLINKCTAIKGDTPQKTAYLAHKCFKENVDYTKY